MIPSRRDRHGIVNVAIQVYNKRFEVVATIPDHRGESLYELGDVSIINDPDMSIWIIYAQGEERCSKCIYYNESSEDRDYEFMILHNAYSIPTNLVTLCGLFTCREFKLKMIHWLIITREELPLDVRRLIVCECCELFRVLDYDYYTVVAV